MKALVISILLVLSPISTFAQLTHSEEIELGTNGRGNGYYSQYFFFDTDHLNVLVRPFWVNNILSRVEFGIGPTTKLGPLKAKWTLGITSDREIQTAALLIGSIDKHSILYIADAKWAMGNTSTALYQKFWWSLDTKEVWRLRYEQLNVGPALAFTRIGFEYQLQFATKAPSHIYIAPFYDPKVNQVGGQIGFRFFDLKF